ncbi:MAG: hypothetical protein HN948_01740, partial [Clostridia bacterium]|nr:hypothetical protein [Clostridia bacterium]
MSKKRGKMAVQLFIITFAVIAVMIGALLVIQSVFFERFYMSWKTSKLEKQLELFVDEVASESLSYSQFLQLRQSFFYENNASINVVRENGSSFEQQLRENQKWLSVLIEYEDGTEKKIVLSEYEIYTNLMGATLDIGATYYIMANDSGDSYQFVLGMMGSEVFAQTGFVEMTGFENEPVVVMDWQEIEVLAIEEATQAERDNYHVSVGAGAVVVGRLLSDTFVDFGIFPFGTGDQINLKIDTASANGEQLSFYLTAS